MRHASRRVVAVIPAALALALVLSPLASAAQQATPLERGRTLSGTVAPGDTARYAVQAGADHLVRGRVLQETVDVAVRILDPEGQQVTRVDGPSRGHERFQVETDAEGSYQLQVIAVDDEGGSFTVVLDLLEPVATDPEELADQLLGAYDGTDSPGAAIQVWRDGRTVFSRGYGMANLGYEVPFDTDTPTNIGSTSKQFTAFAIQLLAQRGELSLDDPVQAHIPELKEFEDTVRVRHLLTHTTGYREFVNLLMMTGRRIFEGDYVARDEILTVVRNQPALQNEPGAEFNYNNTGYGLAAMVVERVSGQSFPEFLAENVFGPLGMDHTQVRGDPRQIVPGASLGYTPDDEGGYMEIRDLGAAVGAGAIYSTVEDLEVWIENYHEPRVGTRAMIDEMMTPFVTTEGDTTGYGMGLFMDEQRGLRRVHHGGADVAHRSQLAYYPEIGAGITVQSNHSGFNTGVAFRLAEAFFEDAMEPEEEAVAEAGGEAFDPESYDPEEFDRLTGRYALEAAPSFIITLEREGDALYTQATGQPRIALEPTSDTSFALQGVPASLTVHTDEDGRGEALTLYQGGQEQRANRIEDEEEAWAPDRAALEAFAGRYLCRELETFYDLVVEEDDEGAAVLVMKQRRLDDATLEPGDEDEFGGGGFQFAFERDRNGLVIGFYLSNVRARDVRFEKLP